MENRKVNPEPVRHRDPVKVKPGDFEPPPNTKQPLVADPPSGAQSPAPSAEAGNASQS
jgi:hypothetical protein